MSVVNRLTRCDDSATVPRMNRTDQGTAEVVQALADHVSRRMFELGINGPSALARETELTVQGLQPLIRGERRKYQARLTNPVCRVFGWTPDSIDRILAGGEPVVVMRPPPIDDLRAALGTLVDQVAASRRALESRSAQIERRLDELTAHVRSLAARVLEQGHE
jgi:hypothetical protein